MLDKAKAAPELNYLEIEATKLGKNLSLLWDTDSPPPIVKNSTNKANEKKDEPTELYHTEDIDLAKGLDEININLDEEISTALSDSDNEGHHHHDNHPPPQQHTVVDSNNDEDGDEIDLS